MRARDVRMTRALLLTLCLLVKISSSKRGKINMRPFVVIRNGDEGLNAKALDYLLQLGVPREDVQRVVLDSRVGDVETITVTLLVRRDVEGG
jgi:hypothetical protein